MSHPAVLAFFEHALKAISPGALAPLRVVEVGAHDVNGSIRGVVLSSIEVSEYVGVDLTPGPGVDIVCSGHELDLPAASFDLTLSAECLEHNPYWMETLRNMRRLTKPDGFVIVSCATLGRLEHGTARTNPDSSPGTRDLGWNYYRNLTPSDFPQDFLASFAAHRFWINRYSRDLYFLGCLSGTIPQALDSGGHFVTIKPIASLFTKATLEFPLAMLRALLSEKLYQEAGVTLLNVRTRAKNLVGGRIE
ncbi:MAG TPA: methyltransferase domain-containing protein [Steroidobacteraceae bacterium]|nr:methyltransferase domain-containing protein [Steroidobacteraceae bacterium]